MAGKLERKDAHLWIRDPLDWYVEPTKSTAQLLAVESFTGWTHDPCCGGGNILKTLADADVIVTGSDVVDRGASFFVGVSDFIATGNLFGAHNCVMNPPYFKAAGSEACIVQALDNAPGKVAAFVNAKFIWGGKRARRLYKARPPSRVWILTDRPSCPPGVWLAAGNEAGGGEQDFLWLVWDERAARLPAGGRPEMGWL